MAEKAQFTGVNEHFEAIFNAAEATQIVFQQPARSRFQGTCCIVLALSFYACFAVCRESLCSPKTPTSPINPTPTVTHAWLTPVAAPAASACPRYLSPCGKTLAAPIRSPTPVPWFSAPLI